MKYYDNKKITFRCRVLTPLFLTGADGAKSDAVPELRTPSLKVVRFWWRAVQAENDLGRKKQKSKEYAKYLLDNGNIVTPYIIIYEVYKKVIKKVLRERGEEAAVMVAAQMNNTRVIELTAGLSLLAAGLSIKHDLPMADAIVYATAKMLHCKVVTSD